MSVGAFKNFIDGQWVAGESVIANINPSDTSDTIGEYARATAADGLAAIEAANRAFDDWAQSGLEQRKAILDFIGNELIARKDEIGAVLAREEGKTLAEGVGEVGRSGQFFQYYAAETLRLMGENTASVRPGVDVDVQREPLGVVAIVTPWNFPLAIFTGQIAAALTACNAVLAKLAEQTPLVGYFTTRLLHQAGVPRRVLQLLPGDGTVGAALTSDARINGLTFTGSTTTAKTIRASVAKNLRPRTPLIAETGGLNAMIVDSTALPEQAVASIIESAF